MQLIIVATIVLGAVVFVSLRAWRALAAARMPKSGCGSDCGCGH